jgi:F0F1-type ATP synthase membrane subunit b/b'
MSAIERGLYVTVGAADLAAEKVRELPAVKFVVERTNKIRQTSLIDQAREIEPKVRKQAKELQTRGEDVVKRVRADAKELRKQIREFPGEARKQIQELPDSARKQATELRDNARKQASELRERVEKAFNRGNGAAKPAPKTTVAKSTTSSASKTV